MPTPGFSSRNDLAGIDGVRDHEAAARSATAIVVGSRGAAGVRRALRGCLSDELSRRAPCPVVVVPHTAVEAAAA